MKTAAFEDLMLDCTDMMTNPPAFAARVLAKAEELKEICKTDTSTQALIREFEESNVEPDKTFTVLFNAIYTYSDEYPIEQMPRIIEAAKQLVKDLETAFRDRTIREAAHRTNPMKDKKLAHALYSTLRERYNDYVDFMNKFFNHDLHKLPPLPGNYGPQTTGLKHYVFIFPDGSEFRNVAAVSRKLGLHPHLVMYQDMIEYLEEHPELEIVTKEVM